MPPFGLDTQAACEASGPHPPPEFGAVAAAGISFGFQTKLPRVEAALPTPEHIMTHTAQDAPDRLAGNSRCPCDLLDRRAGGREGLDLRVDSRARQRAFPLQPLGPRQRGRVDDGLWRQCFAQ
jgi:hypothetical protein